MNQTVIQLSSGMIEFAKFARATTSTRMLPAPLTQKPPWLMLAVLHKKKMFSLGKDGVYPVCYISHFLVPMFLIHCQPARRIFQSAFHNHDGTLGTQPCTLWVWAGTRRS